MVTLGLLGPWSRNPLDALFDHRNLRKILAEVCCKVLRWKGPGGTRTVENGHVLWRRKSRKYRVQSSFVEGRPPPERGSKTDWFANRAGASVHRAEGPEIGTCSFGQKKNSTPTPRWMSVPFVWN